MAEGLLHRVGNGLWVVDPFRPLRYGADAIELVVHLVKLTAVEALEVARNLPGDDQHRSRSRSVGRPDGRGRVEQARARHHHSGAHASAGAGVAVGHVGGGLLVPGRYETDAGVAVKRVGGVVELVARHAEHDLDPVPDQRLGQRFSTGHSRHRYTPVSVRFGIFQGAPQPPVPGSDGLLQRARGAQELAPVVRGYAGYAAVTFRTAETMSSRSDCAMSGYSGNSMSSLLICRATGTIDRAAVLPEQRMVRDELLVGDADCVDALSLQGVGDAVQVRGELSLDEAYRVVRIADRHVVGRLRPADAGKCRRCAASRYRVCACRASWMRPAFLSCASAKPACSSERR